MSTTTSHLPFGWKWRSNPWFITFVIGLGIFANQLSFSLIVPVIPFRLEAVGIKDPSFHSAILFILFSVGQLISSLVCADVFYRHPYRRGPLLVALVIAILANLLYMLAKPFWCLAVSRVMEGACCGAVWTLGLAVIIENIDKEVVGRHLGWATAGQAIGQSFGPTLGGFLYSRVGWHGPFILGMSVLGLDAIGRLLMLEKRHLNPTPLPEDLVPPVIEESKEESFATATPNLTATSYPPFLEDSRADCADKVPDIESQNNSGANRENEGKNEIPHLDSRSVLRYLLSSPRGATSLFVILCVGLCYNSSVRVEQSDLNEVWYDFRRSAGTESDLDMYSPLQDAILSLRIADVWHKDTGFIGLMYLAVAILTPIPGPITGWMSDRWGAESVLPLNIFLLTPWLPLMILKNSLAGFVISFGTWNFLETAMIPVIGHDLAMVAKQSRGQIEQIHVMGAFASAGAVGGIIGPMAMGVLYDKGLWNVDCWLIMGIMLLTLPFVVVFTGDRPLWTRLMGTWGVKRGTSSERDEVAGES